jgi:hypothetical protein
MTLKIKMTYEKALSIIAQFNEESGITLLELMDKFSSRIFRVP